MRMQAPLHALQSHPCYKLIHPVNAQILHAPMSRLRNRLGRISRKSLCQLNSSASAGLPGLVDGDVQSSRRSEECSTSGREQESTSSQASRRNFLLAAGACAAVPAAAAQAPESQAAAAAAAASLPEAQLGVLTREACREAYAAIMTSPNWFGPGPLAAQRLPIKLTHVLTSCYVSGFAGTACQVKFDVFYPKGGAALGLGPPYPLALITSGFLVSSEAYKSYAERLASWGYAVLLYDKQETVSDVLDDVTSVAALRQCIDLAASDPLIKRVADPSRVYLVGHSRGGKISALTALEDPRVVALCLLDPVDNTVYAPIAPGFPSAVAALQGNPSTSEGPSSKANKARTSSQTETSGSGSNSGGGGGGSISMSSGSSSSGNGDDGARDRGSRGAAVDSAREPSACRVSAGAAAGAASGSGNGSRTGVGACASLPPSFPVAIVGSGIGGDCAPMDANYQQFFKATRGPTWEVGLQNAGHFQYLDMTSPLQSYLCPAGSAPDSQVRNIARGVVVAWAELCFRHNGHDVLRDVPAAPLQEASRSLASSLASSSSSSDWAGRQQGAWAAGGAGSLWGGRGKGPGAADGVQVPGTGTSSSSSSSILGGGSSKSSDNGSEGRVLGQQGAGEEGRAAYPFACVQEQMGAAVPAGVSQPERADAPRSRWGQAQPPGLEQGLAESGRGLQDVQGPTNQGGGGGAKQQGPGRAQPIVFDRSLPESLEAVLALKREEVASSVDVRTRFKGFRDEAAAGQQ